jgi:hypothetical protein
VSGFVGTGVHHHAAFILLAGRTIGAGARRGNVKPGPPWGNKTEFTLSHVRKTR